MRFFFVAAILAVMCLSANAAKWTVYVNSYGSTMFGDTISASDKDTVDLVFQPEYYWNTVSASVMLDSTANQGCDSFNVRAQFFPAEILQTDMIPGDSIRYLTVGIDSLQILSLADSVYWEDGTGDSTALIDYTGTDGTATKFLWSDDYILNTARIVRHIVSCGTGCSYIFIIHVHRN